MPVNPTVPAQILKTSLRLLFAAVVFALPLRSLEAQEPAPLVVGANVGDLAAATEQPVEPLVVKLEDYRDPLEPLNRVVFVFNDFTARYALVPLGKGYQRVVPRPVRAGVGNVFRNLKMPIHAVNQLLQGRPKKSGRSIARFAVNTTLGIGGIFDPAAKRFDLPSQETDFESTLARYGAGYGIYLQIPFFGPSDLRNGSGLVVDYFLNPVPYFTENPNTLLINGFDFFQEFAPSADEYEKLRAKADDPYLFFRNLYLQDVERDAVYEGSE